MDSGRHLLPPGPGYSAPKHAWPPLAQAPKAREVSGGTARLDTNLRTSRAEGVERRMKQVLITQHDRRAHTSMPGGDVSTPTSESRIVHHTRQSAAEGGMPNATGCSLQQCPDESRTSVTQLVVGTRYERVAAVPNDVNSWMWRAGVLEAMRLDEVELAPARQLVRLGREGQVPDRGRGPLTRQQGIIKDRVRRQPEAVSQEHAHHRVAAARVGGDPDDHGV